MRLWRDQLWRFGLTQETGVEMEMEMDGDGDGDGDGAELDRRAGR